MPPPRVLMSLSHSFPRSAIPNAAQEFYYIHRIQSSKSIQQLKQIHAAIIKSEPLQVQLSYSKLISHCIREDLNYARAILASFKDPEVCIYNAAIRYFSSHKNSSLEALLVFREMTMSGNDLDTYNIPFALKACAQLGCLEEGKEIHSLAIKTGLIANLYVRNTLMRMYAVCGSIHALKSLFDESTERDLVSWTTLIQGYVKMGSAKEGVDVFFRMCEQNVRADEMMLVIVLSACARLGDLSLGRKIHRFMEENEVKRDVFVGNALVDMYLKCGDAVSAQHEFDKISEKNVISWNSMISGLAQQGEFKMALVVFQQMQSKGFKPDDITLVGALNSCANLGALELGKWLNAYINKNGIRADGYIGNALVDMYAKCGSIDEALRIFKGMKLKDVYTYTTMIIGMSMHSQGEKALSLFSEMARMGIEPDEVTFVGVLTACSHAGLLAEGRKHFKDMIEVYKLHPQTEHYGCMVDLLGRAGLIEEAEELIRSMPMEPDGFVWGALLGACSLHGKVELGQSVLERLIEIEPEKDGAYILMSNIYSSANRWRDALKMRKAMKEIKLKKNPGCSSIEVDGEVHEFRKSDKSHPQMKDIHLTLAYICCHLKNFEHLENALF